TLDSSFASRGVALIKNRGPLSDLSVNKSGAIFAILSLNQLSPQTCVVRFTSAGNLDKTFSDDGISDPQSLRSDGMFVNSDGSVLLVAHAVTAQRQVLVRFTSAGKVDSKFGVNGVQTLAGKKFIRGTPIELADGSRYLCGSISSSLSSDARRIFVSKLSSHNQFDRGFGVDGVITLASPNLQDLPVAVATDSAAALNIAAATFTRVNQARMTQEIFAVPEVSS